MDPLDRIAEALERIADSLERYEVHAGIFLHSLNKDQEAHIVLNRIISQLSVTKRLLEHINESK